MLQKMYLADASQRWQNDYAMLPSACRYIFLVERMVPSESWSEYFSDINYIFSDAVQCQEINVRKDDALTVLGIMNT